jgi:DNA polymerase III delta prime subunit
MATKLPYGLTKLKLKYRGGDDYPHNQSLWGWYRPLSTSEFYGPSAVFLRKFSKTLMDNQKKREASGDTSDGLLHSYLLTGDPGSGKTSVAVALGKLLNCASPEEEDGLLVACNECQWCRAADRNIMAGRDMGTRYIDSAQEKTGDVSAVLQEYFGGVGMMSHKNTVLIFEEAQNFHAKTQQLLLTWTEKLTPSQYMFLVSSDPKTLERNTALMSRLDRYHIRSWKSREILDVLKDIAANEEVRGAQPHIPEEVLALISENCDENVRLAVNLLMTRVYQEIEGDHKTAIVDAAKMIRLVAPGTVSYAITNTFAAKIMRGESNQAVKMLFDQIIPALEKGLEKNDRTTATRNFAFGLSKRMRANFKAAVKRGNLTVVQLMPLIKSISVFEKTLKDQLIFNHSDDALILAVLEALVETENVPNLIK